jgi:hypothetical protein
MGGDRSSNGYLKPNYPAIDGSTAVSYLNAGTLKQIRRQTPPF